MKTEDVTAYILEARLRIIETLLLSLCASAQRLKEPGELRAQVAMADEVLRVASQAVQRDVLAKPHAIAATPEERAHLADELEALLESFRSRLRDVSGVYPSAPHPSSA
jgi:hypothetical protein